MTDDLRIQLQEQANKAAYWKERTVQADALAREAESEVDGLRIQMEHLREKHKEEQELWRERAEYWQQMWSRTANRLMQVDPEFNKPSETVADELKKLERVLSSDNPNPWKDV